MNFIFSMHKNIKVLYKCMQSFWLCMIWLGMPKLPKVKHLLFLCIILRKDWMMKLMFCMQVSIEPYYKLILWFWWRWSSIPKVTKIASSQCLYNISIKKLEMKFDFLQADKHQSGLQVDFNTLDTNVSYKMILLLSISMMKHSRSTQSNKFPNLCNVSEKKLGMHFIFSIQMKIKVSKSGHYRFWWKRPDISKVSKIES